MLESAWLFIGLMGILSTGVALSTQTESVAQSGSADGIAIISGIVGFLSWGVWTFGTLEVESVTSSGSIVTSTMPELTMLGIVFSLVPGYVALTGPVEIIRRSVDDPGTKDI
jgi:hypothetical protein